MNEERAKRKLTAILSADVKGYSRLMGDNELATIETLKKYRQLISFLIDQFRGRVVDSPGDNLLAEFGSVVDAVECAAKIQEELKRENAEYSESRRMDFRIGVNVGDVVEEEERIYGDGVNIAARLESLSEPGGICISGFVYDQVKNRLKLNYKYIGEKRVKNITEPLLVYRILSAPADAEHLEPAKEERMAYPLPDRPSIAVLPFTNMSGDPSQEYIGDGLSENIISALSISSKLFVIARNSTFTYKGKPVKVQQVAEELGVQYVLEGSVQKSGDCLRVTAQLIDALTGHHLWSEVYDREMKELFDLQDEITKKILLSIHGELRVGDDILLVMKSTDSLEALKHYIKGEELFLKLNREDNIKARQHFRAAAKLDPEYVGAITGIGWSYLTDAVFRWSDSPFVSGKNAFEFAQKALELNEQHAHAYTLLGEIYLYQSEHEKAIAEAKRAISLNPNFAIGHSHLARIMYLSGRFDQAITLMKKAIRLNPKLPDLIPDHLSYLACSYIFLGRFEEALEVIEQMDEKIQGDRAWISAYCYSFVYQGLGKEEEARAKMAEAIKTNPEISIESFKTYQPFQNRADLQKILYALRMSGMPEKPRNAMQEKPSIAVLPFVNMSKDPEQEYFSDGMSEEIIGALAKLEGLKVISRTSAFYFKGEHVDLRTIGEKLKVENVLEGSVRKAGKKLRISAQLIKVDDDTHLWAETYDRELEDVFAIQDEISHSIVKNLKGKLLGRQTEPLVKDYTKNTEAYQFFLKGKFFHSRSVSEWEMAIESYEKAINTDPEFAPPYSNLASIYITYALAHSLPSREMWVKIKKLVRKALEIDETNSEAHASMGFIKAWFEFDWSGADSAHNRAIELNPGSSVAYYRYAIFLMGVGRVYEATDKMKQALEFDPLSVFLHATLGITYYFAHQFDKAIVQMQKTLELVPNEPYAIGVLALSHAVKGVYEEGIEILQQANDIPLLTTFLGYIYGKAGEKEEAQKILNDFLGRSKHGYFSPVLIAAVYAGLGYKDEVFEWLEIAFEDRAFHNWCIKTDPMFDDVRSDPRWAEQMKKRGLTD